MTETLVIVNIVDGIADTSIVHQPATQERYGGEGQSHTTFNQHAFPPRTWPSACGQVEHGFVYSHAGLLEDAPTCFDCQVAMLVQGA